MSGGHFSYRQHNIIEIFEAVENLILKNDTDEGHDFKPETIAEFQAGVTLLRRAYIYAQRIDWLVSGDDDEETFHKRLKDDLDKEAGEKP